ncbi:hypothetical protein RUESEDTHA_02353 [Ruegeria sp. THAF57]|uniref:hypothetical protein n=1 Tax=Ruegeria sp. THAF57 TaxID=2744555 RepID=UPI0015DDDA06|nr:hypothetical protein [Ruegeria sp. THAF57]CAD0185466.1 hypothetical protein RUESEDTHA_02353 [Ruegeria sp. THAF57]
MKTVLRLLIPVLTLTSCGPLSMYYREGESVSRMQTDTTECRVQAVNNVPVATQVRQSPPTYWPGRTYCHGNGRCYRSAGWWQPGQVYTVDVNQGLRNNVEAQCMAKKGYRPVSLPPCRQNVKSRVPAQRTTQFPPLSTESCFVKFNDGAFQIITPGVPG